MKAVLDFGNASLIGERIGEMPYKPVGTEKDKVKQNPVSVLYQKDRQDIHMDLINYYN